MINFDKRSILNFYLYSSLHISIAASVFTLESFFIAQVLANWYFIGLVFSSTLFIYSLHRIIGIKKLDQRFVHGRFKIIMVFKSQIVLYTIMSFFATIYFVTKLDTTLLLAMIIPGLISVTYTLPIFKNEKRLRDFNYLKILLIAFTWAFIALIPLFIPTQASLLVVILVLLFVEKLFYIFAITLPFDIRDKDVDAFSGIKTFASIVSPERIYKLIYLLLFICLAISLTITYLIKGINFPGFILVTSAYVFSYFAVKLTHGKKSDLYYSGLLDGVIILRSILIILGYSYFL